MRWLVLVLGVLTLAAASTGNDPEAWYRMGLGYDYGEGTEQNHARALQWYLQAAEQGHIPAQVKAGDFFTLGTGSEVDLAEAAAWYRRAAEQGHVGAQQNLAAMYDSGRGVAQDLRQATELYRRAAAQGAPNAQAWLGRAFATGRGAVADPLLAFVWYSVAAVTSSGIEARTAAANRDLAAAQLSPARLAEAQERARVCTQSGFKTCD